MSPFCFKIHLIIIAGLAVLCACSRGPDVTEAGEGAVAEKAIDDAATSAGVSQNNILNCTVPVSGNLSAKALTEIYRGEARINVVSGLEGEVHRGVILYSKQARRRMEVLFWDTAMTRVSDVTIGPAATDWVSFGGVRVGSTLSEVAAINGKAFTLMGFGWDAGGSVVDFRGGKLTKLQGGCQLRLRFNVPQDQGTLPPALIGDHPLSSDDQALTAITPVITDVRLSWPQS